MTDYSAAIRKLAALTLCGFAIICLMLGYWQVLMAPQLDANVNNQRPALRLQRVKPGQVLTADGVVILGWKQHQGSWVATYPEGKYFCHLTGYNAVSGLQASMRDALYGLNKFNDPWQALLHGGPVGNDVTLTIDSAAQKLATRELAGKRGAVVALDPSTGAVLALVSAPAYDPNSLKGPELQLFLYNPASPGLDRALQGMYPPGSVFKIFTAAVGLDTGVATPHTQFTCAGVERVAGARIVCWRRQGHGLLDLTQALCESCNIAFAKLGVKIGVNNFISYVKRFHLLDPANLGVPSMAGRMYNFRGFKGKIGLAEASFGQGATLMTPFQVARLTAAIANGGHVLQPYLVAKVTTPGGRVLLRGHAIDFGQAVSATTAAQVAGMMAQVVERGTGRVASLSGVTVAGKTGSAQNPHGAAHSWFTCFAPARKPQVVVTVVVENGGEGAAVAAPIARNVLAELLKNHRQ